MAESGDLHPTHPTAGRRRREKGPPSGILTAPGALPRLERVSDTESEHSDDSAGEKEAKRQRSEPTTPVSTSSRLPYEYDALMGITRVGTKEAEGFEEDLGIPRNTMMQLKNQVRKEETDVPQLELRSMGFQGGYGSSSLKECIELLNATSNNTPAPLDSGVGQKPTDPSHTELTPRNTELDSKVTKSERHLLAAEFGAPGHPRFKNSHFDNKTPQIPSFFGFPPSGPFCA